MSSPVKVERYPYWMVEVAGRFSPPTSSKREVIHLADGREAQRYRRFFAGLQNALERSGQRGDYADFLSVHFIVRGSDLHLLHADEYIPRPNGV